jgi:hypothetical protein
MLLIAQAQLPIHDNGKEKVYITFLTFAKVRFSSLHSKTEQNTSLNFKNRLSYLTGPVISSFEGGFVFSFLFILVESLKIIVNHRKIIK